MNSVNKKINHYCLAKVARGTCVLCRPVKLLQIFKTRRRSSTTSTNYCIEQYCWSYLMTPSL